MIRCAYLVLMALCVSCTSGCFVFMNVDLTTSKSPYQERVLAHAESWWTSDKIALIDLHGVLAKQYGGSSLLAAGPGRDPVSDFSEALSRAACDPDVRAVVLRIDSPGGYVSWSDIMYRELCTFREKSDKPVVACVTGIGASGAYYVALAADEIHAGPAATVGSIGVIALFLNLEELADKIGVEVQVVKSGDKKDMGGLWRGLKPEERDVMEAMIGEFHTRFVDLVARHRTTLTKEQAGVLADGRLYTASQAHAKGLIDRIAYLDESVDAAKRLAGIEDAALVTYARGQEYKHNIYSEGAGAPTVNVVNLDLRGLAGVSESGFYYLWLPER